MAGELKNEKPTRFQKSAEFLEVLPSIARSDMLKHDSSINKIDRCVLKPMESCSGILDKRTVRSSFFLSGSELDHTAGNVDSVTGSESLG